MTNKVGEIIKKIQFSAEEKIRLRNQIIDKETLQHKILVEKTLLITVPKFWKSAIKVFGVTGFRNTSDAIRPIILNRVLSNFSLESKSKEFEFSWVLYKNCVIDYVADELRNLNELLLKESCEVTTDNITKTIFNNIITKAALYNVSNDDIRQLYDIWGFQRVENFEQIITSEYVSNDILQKVVKTYDDKINDIKLHLNSIANAMKEDKKIINALSDIDELKKNNKLFPKTIASELKKHADDILTNLVNPLNKKYMGLLELVNKIGSKCDVVEENLNQIMIKVADIESINEVAQSEFQDRINDLNDKCNILESVMKIHSDCRDKPNASLPSNQNTLSDIASAWLGKWENSGYKNASLQGLMALLSVLKSGKLFLLDNAQCLSLLTDMIPGITVEKVTASPHWLSQDDWSNRIKFIEDIENNYKMLAIFDFDVALQDTYLLPFIIEWLNSSTSRFTKIFLIPSIPDSKQINKRIFELAITFYFDDFMEESLGNMVIPVDASHIGIKSHTVLLPQYIFANQYSNLNYRQNLIEVLRREGVSNYLISNFINIVKHLDELFVNSMSINLAAHLTYIPWLKATSGPVAVREAEEIFINISRNENA